MTLQQLNYFITIAKYGSLSKSADALYISQPSLTGSLKELESEVGFKLFNRGSKGVTLTNEGSEFLLYAKQVYSQYEQLEERFIKAENFKKRFCVSTQHYSFAVKAFINTVKQNDPQRYEFAIRESQTRDVISAVASLRSEIGILYLSDFNRKAILKLLGQNELEFHRLKSSKACVFLHKSHPLANKKSIRSEELLPYPCLSFEQGETGSFYYAEEIFGSYDTPKVIKANDRASMLNLMEGLLGYTVCSAIVNDGLYDGDYVVIPFDKDDLTNADNMELGYITRKNTSLSDMGKAYVAELLNVLDQSSNNI